METVLYCKGCGDRLYPNLAIPSGLDREGYELACSEPCKERMTVFVGMASRVAPLDFEANCGRCGVRPRDEGDNWCPECRKEGRQWQGDILLATEGFHDQADEDAEEQSDERTEREREEE